LNVRVVPVRMVSMRNLMGVRTEEATFTFSSVKWEVPFQGPFFKAVEGL